MLDLYDVRLSYYNCNILIWDRRVWAKRMSVRSPVWLITWVSLNLFSKLFPERLLKSKGYKSEDEEVKTELHFRGYVKLRWNHFKLFWKKKEFTTLTLLKQIARVLRSHLVKSNTFIVIYSKVIFITTVTTLFHMISKI